MTLAPGVLNFSNHTGSHASDNAKHKCSEHLGNQYVYFCLSQNCHKPICVQCEKVHSFEHQNAGTTENYVSFSEHLRSQFETLRILIEKSKTIKSAIQKQLQQKRNKYLKIINSHFDNLEKSAQQIQLHPKYLEEIQRNYKQMQQGKSYCITQNIENENIPQFVDNTEQFEQHMKNTIYIKPGIQIVSNEQYPSRKRHQSQKISFPKDRWVDGTEKLRFRQQDVRSHGDKNQMKISSTEQLASIVKPQESDKTKTILPVPELNKSFEIKNEKKDQVINFKTKPKKEIAQKEKQKIITTPLKNLDNPQIQTLQFRQ